MLIQNLDINDVSSERRNPILANVMAQLNYMEKRGSDLIRICNESKALEGCADELRPMFKSTPTQFQTIIFASPTDINVGDYVGDVSEIKLIDRQQKIIGLIKDNPTITDMICLGILLSDVERMVLRNLLSRLRLEFL